VVPLAVNEQQIEVLPRLCEHDAVDNYKFVGFAIRFENLAGISSYDESV